MNDRQTHPHELISAMIDGEVDARERAIVESHIRECAACRDLAADLEALGEALGDEPVPPVPAGLASRIGWRLRSEDVARRRRHAGRGRPRLRMLTALGGVAAAAVLAVLVVQEGNVPWIQREAPGAPQATAPPPKEGFATIDGSVGTDDAADRERAKKTDARNALESPQRAGETPHTMTYDGSAAAGGMRGAGEKERPVSSQKGVTPAARSYGDYAPVPGAAQPSPRAHGGEGSSSAASPRAVFSPEPPASPPPAADSAPGAGSAANVATPTQEGPASSAPFELGKTKSTARGTTLQDERQKALAAESRRDGTPLQRASRSQPVDKTEAEAKSRAEADKDADLEEESAAAMAPPGAAAPGTPPAPLAPPPPKALPEPAVKASEPSDEPAVTVPPCPVGDAGSASRWAFSSAPLAGLEVRADAERSLSALAVRLGGSLCAQVAVGGESLLVLDVPAGRYAELRAGLAAMAQMPPSPAPPAQGYGTVRVVVRPK